MLVIHQLQ